MDYNKNVLIISHNPLSETSNNGKTLASIFEGVPKENIYQIYLSAEKPNYSDMCHYLQINEKQILKSILCCENQCCKEVNATFDKQISVTISMSSFANQTKRLLRELIWKFGLWRPKLAQWLKDKRFDAVFFMAGDGLFAYDVYSFVMESIEAKGCMFFTDDYVIGRSSCSPVAFIRRFLLRRKIHQSLKITKELFVISDEMKNAYYDIFHRDSCVVRNFSVESVSCKDKKNISDDVVMIYAGGLHYNRWKVLAEIANAINQINEHSRLKCRLEIYSAQNVSQNILEEISIDGVSEFKGSIPASQIAAIYSKADVLVHVESFDKKAMASTMYSFSTKIPEYMSAGKCIFAVGPNEVASMRYLLDVACVANDQSSILSRVDYLLNNAQYRACVGNRCREKFEQDFSNEKQKECLNQIFSIIS